MILNTKIKEKLISDFYNFVPLINEFDKNHIKLVTNKAIELSIIRKLDSNLVELIATFHDIGRIKEDLDSFNHSESGAEFLVSYYSIVPFDNFNIMITSIREHSKKAKITTAYSEVLKDADTYAHYIENSILNEKEKIRLQYIDYPSIKLECNKNELLREIIISYNEYLLILLESVNVHETRTTIRTLRSLISLLDNTIYHHYFKKLNKLLKEISKYFEYSRKLTVFKQEISECTLIPQLDKTIEKEDIEIFNKNIHFKPQLETMIQDFPKTISINLNPLLEEHLLNYKKTINKIALNDIHSLHKLRIKGKKIKYLMENNLVIYDSRNLTVIQQLGKSIGALNDIEENLLILKNNTFRIEKDDKKRIKLKLNNEKIVLLNEIKKEVFILRLLVSR